jgi:PAP2 superfamily
VLFGVFAAFAALARVYLGIHYPSDIVVGALIGIATSLAVNREAVRTAIAAPILSFEARYPPYFYGLFFLALAELSGGFPNTRRIGVAIVHLFVGYNPGCVKTRLSQGRAELFSQLSSRRRSRWCNRVQQRRN